MGERIVVEAVVLRTAAYRESSRMVTLFTPQGLLGAAARGVMRPKSRLRAATEVFARGSFTLAGRQGHYVLAEAEILNPHIALRERLEHLSCAFYLRDFCQAIAVEGESHAGLYALFCQALNALCHKNGDYRAIQTFFEIRAMAYAGFQPAFDACALCGAPAPQGLFSPAAGGCVCAGCAAQAPGAAALLPGTWAYMRRLAAWDEEALNILKSQSAIQAQVEEHWGGYVRYHLERRMDKGEYLARVEKFTTERQREQKLRQHV